MTALPNNDPSSDKPIRQYRRMTPHMDFTPMVDLGFLLITFFMLSTTLSKPQIMPLVMPDNHGEFEPAKESKVLTLLLGNHDKVYWYEGLNVEELDSTTFGRDGLREIILQKMDKVKDQWGLQLYKEAKTGVEMQGSYLSVIIKPGTESRYNNLVDVLDEMAICRVRYYCVMPLGTEEARRITLNQSVYQGL